MISCCSKLVSDEKLTIPRKDYLGTELRTDGYYYEINNDLTSIYFLYRNGIILYAYSYRNKTLEEIESEIISQIKEGQKIHKSRFGVFIVEGNTITIEQWAASTGFSLPVVRSYGTIQNDSTFLVTKTYSSETQKERSANLLYHFRQFNNKPDSTNVFIQ
jgi:hypothetical protein